MEEGSQQLHSKMKQEEFSLVPLGRDAHLDIAYRTITNKDISNQSLRHSLITGSIFKNVSFVDVDMSRCDLVGSKFSKCRFIRCTIVPAEIRSCEFGECKFEECDFSGGSIDSSRFDQTSFKRCDFTGAIISENNFNQCKLDNDLTKSASIISNRFQETNFVGIKFGDCTLQFTFFIHCDFLECMINAEAMGSCYGISEKQIHEIGLIYLGKEQPVEGTETIVDDLIETYIARHWLSGILILKLNYREKEAIDAAINYCGSTSTVIDHFILPEMREIRFIFDVLTIKIEQEKAPLILLLVFNEILKKLDRENTDIKYKQKLRSVSFECIILFEKSIREISSLLLPSNENFYDQIEIELTLERALSVDVLTVLSIIWNSFGQKYGEAPKLVGRRDGSIIETFQCAAVVATTFLSVLVFFRKSLEEVIKIKASVDKLFGNQEAEKTNPSSTTVLSLSLDIDIVTPPIREQASIAADTVSQIEGKLGQLEKDINADTIKKVILMHPKS